MEIQNCQKGQNIIDIKVAKDNETKKKFFSHYIRGHNPSILKLTTNIIVVLEGDQQNFQFNQKWRWAIF